MRHTCTILGKWLLVAAMISAIGGHWVVLQSVAWTTMVFTNVKHTSLGIALEQTFDGSHPCELCKAIAQSRQSEKKQDVQTSFSKINLFYQARVITLIAPHDYWERQLVDTFSPQRPVRPILKPPRGFIG